MGIKVFEQKIERRVVGGLGFASLVFPGIQEPLGGCQQRKLFQFRRVVPLEMSHRFGGRKLKSRGASLKFLISADDFGYLSCPFERVSSLGISEFGLGKGGVSEIGFCRDVLILEFQFKN